ncbi:MAG: hypothetical protein WD341_19545 [Tistlia sp.]|uniref:hypothetical protein n=1 Tax=Tistlia sp. TaxID=3057121 RepID=UPI0034A4D62F
MTDGGGFVDRWKLLGAIAADKALPPAAVVVAYWQLDYFGALGSYLAVESLEMLTGRDRRTVQRALRALVKAGYFREVSKGGRRGGRGHTNLLWPKCSLGTAYHAEAKAKMPQRASISPPFPEPAGNEAPEDAEKGVNPDQKGRQDCPQRASTSPPYPSCIFPPEKNPPALPPSAAPDGAMNALSNLEGEKAQKTEARPETTRQADRQDVARQGIEHARNARAEREERAKLKLCKLAECEDDMFGADGEEVWQAVAQVTRERWVSVIDSEGAKGLDEEMALAIEGHRQHKAQKVAANALLDRLEALAGAGIPKQPDRAIGLLRVIQEVDQIQPPDRTGAQRRLREILDRQIAGTLEDEELQPYAAAIRDKAA